MKISEKLKKVNDNFTINMYENGYMVEIGGRDFDDDWKTMKIVCNELKEVVALIEDISKLERD